MQYMWSLLARHDIIKAVEELIQDTIADNDQSITAIQNLENQQLAIVIEPPDISLVISVKNARLQIDKDANNPDLRITGSLLAISKLALAENKQSIIESEYLRVEGATRSLYAWHRLFKSLNPEWEMKLARRIGPIPARMVITPIKILNKQAKSAIQHMTNNIEHALVWNEYAVTDSELQEFFDVSHDLRSRVEQLNNRINKLL